MKQFVWQGLDRQGKKHSGKLFERSVEDVRKRLLAQHIALLNSKEVNEGGIRGRILGLLHHRAPLKEQIEFFEHLAVLLESGIALDDSLHALYVQPGSASQKQLIASMRTSIQSGSSFSQALENAPIVHKHLVTPLIQASELTGNLSGSLAQLAAYLREEFSFALRLRQATFLPLLTLCFTGVTMLVILWVVVPQFEQFTVFTDEALPLITRIVFGISGWVRSGVGMVVIASFLGLLLAGILFRKTPFVSPGYQAVIQRFPILGKILSLRDSRTFFATWALLSNGGVRSKQALELALKTLPYGVQRQVAERILNEIDAGIAFAQALEYTNHPLFPPVFIRMVSSGQESGNLPRMLARAAHFAAQLLHEMTDRFIARAAPILIIVTGLLITLLMLAVYVPIFTLAHRLS